MLIHYVFFSYKIDRQIYYRVFIRKNIDEKGDSVMITFIYYLFCAYIAFLLVWNFVESDSVYEEVMYAFVVMPFILRILLIK